MFNVLCSDTSKQALQLCWRKIFRGSKKPLQKFDSKTKPLRNLPQTLVTTIMSEYSSM